MKKILSFLMAAVLIFAMAVPAFAADDTNVADGSSGVGSDSADVKATYEALTDDDEVDTVYLVNISWDVNSTLKYSDGKQTFTWNADDTKYEADEVVDKDWTGNATVGITVTNKSNADVTAAASWANASDITANCDFGNNATVTVESAAKDVEVKADEAGAPKTQTINATVTVTNGSISTDNATVGTITVNINPADD